MGFYRTFCSRDTWITNTFTDDLFAARASGSNLGADPSLSVYTYMPDQASGTGSMSVARTLLYFDLTELSGKVYTDKIIPSSSVKYYLRMFNQEHESTVPTSYDIKVYPVSSSWDEGTGRDEVNFRDAGYANWVNAKSTVDWTSTGSDFYSSLNFGTGSQHFDRGSEDLDIEITNTVICWFTGSIPNYGLVVMLSQSQEDGAIDRYKKVFHGRESKYIDRLPFIEARWSSVLKDNRYNFGYNVTSSLYVYNFIRGELTDLAEPILVRIQDHVVGVSASYSATVTASFVETGIYSASFCIRNTASFSSSWRDIWHSGSGSGSVVYMTGTFTPLVLTGSNRDQYEEYTIDIDNLKRAYNVDEEVRLLVSVRKRDWITHVGVLSSASDNLTQDREYIEKMYYSIVNDDSGEVVVPFGTGSVPYTQLSYDGNGNYFNLAMNSFVPGFVYRIKFLIDINKYDKKIYDEDYRFKVV